MDKMTQTDAFGELMYIYYKDKCDLSIQISSFSCTPLKRGSFSPLNLLLFFSHGCRAGSREEIVTQSI